jgi:hypothetical protein
MPGVSVTFQAPASGPSGTFADTHLNTTSVITDASGVATSPIITANNVAGNFSVQASISNLEASAAFQLTNLASVNCTVVNGGGSATLFQPYKQYDWKMANAGGGISTTMSEEMCCINGRWLVADLFAG